MYLIAVAFALATTWWLWVPFLVLFFIGTGFTASIRKESGSGLPVLTVLTAIFIAFFYFGPSARGVAMPAPPTVYGILVDVLLYFGIGITSSLFRWWLYCKGARRAFATGSVGARTASGYPAVIRENGSLEPSSSAKYKVTAWLVYWPFFLLSFVFGDLWSAVYHTIVDAVDTLIKAIARAA
jgi:antibiotic biosynthesis monooxygenase (ABM) superfamily enzyme